MILNKYPTHFVNKETLLCRKLTKEQELSHLGPLVDAKLLLSLLNAATSSAMSI